MLLTPSSIKYCYIKRLIVLSKLRAEVISRPISEGVLFSENSWGYSDCCCNKFVSVSLFVSRVVNYPLICVSGDWHACLGSRRYKQATIVAKEKIRKDEFCHEFTQKTIAAAFITIDRIDKNRPKNELRETDII